MMINSKEGAKQQPALAVQGVDDIQNSNLEPNPITPITTPAGSDHSVTRTRSLCSHQNVCLDGCRSIETDEVQLAQLASTFIVKTTPAQENVKAQRESGGQNDKEISANSSPSGPPPGFEVAVNGSKLAPNHTPVSSKSTQSLDSTVKLAEESLQIGNLLGLKVTHNKKEAVAKITRTLRSNSKKLQQNQVKTTTSQRIQKRI